jgi:hypothetical protein
VPGVSSGHAAQPDRDETGDAEMDEGMADAIPTVYTDARDVAALGELAEAERAAARRGATPAQAAGLRAAGRPRRTEDRIALWRSAQGPGPDEPDPGDRGSR